MIAPVDVTAQDAEVLLRLPEFRRFMFVAIQAAGIIGQTGTANGQIGRDLSEGRRSLGFEMLQMADRGQPEPLRSPDALATLNAILLEALNPPVKEKTSARSRNDRFADLGDD
ncbi:hypothetical protein [Novosphingobium rosa]|uniref:hypothetical protein n=1 Tax=Novosphingobium rosa TaxID=76978 RepID=UPI0008375AA4|nr:hypothetical protein [Novosphingobium rosa]